MSMSKIDSTSATLVVQWYEAAVIVGPEGKNVKELKQSTGARIMVEDGKAKHKGTRTITLRGDSSTVTRAMNEIEKYRFSNCTAKVAISGLMARAIFSEAKTKFLNEVMMECKVLIGRDHFQYPKTSSPQIAKKSARGRDGLGLKPCTDHFWFQESKRICLLGS